MQPITLFDDDPEFGDVKVADAWRPRNLGAYGLGPENLVLCADFIWRPAGSLRPGDRLISFEDQILEGQRRRLVIGSVTSCRRVSLPSYRFRFTGNRVIVVGEETSLLSGQKGGNWTRARYVSEGRPIRDLGIPWDVGHSWEHGWLAGAFDGEANLSTRTKFGGGWNICFTQNPGPVMDLAERLLAEMGYETRRKNQAGVRVEKLLITGIYDCFRFLGECRPVRFLDKSDPWVERGSPTRTRGSARQRRYDAPVSSADFVGMRDVVSLESTTRTMFAEGLFVGAGVTHKSRVMPTTMRRR